MAQKPTTTKKKGKFRTTVILTFLTISLISLSATGYYRTPRINYDRTTFSGRPFFYFAYGAAVSEVVVDVLTGEHRDGVAILSEILALDPDDLSARLFRGALRLDLGERQPYARQWPERARGPGSGERPTRPLGA